ncbi:MAG: hypothetical protein ACJAUW_000818 [Yoonia sp.]
MKLHYRVYDHKGQGGNAGAKKAPYLVGRLGCSMQPKRSVRADTL